MGVPKINRSMQRAMARCVEAALEKLGRDDEELLVAISEEIAEHNGRPAGGWDNWFWETDNAIDQRSKK